MGCCRPEPSEPPRVSRRSQFSGSDMSKPRVPQQKLPKQNVQPAKNGQKRAPGKDVAPAADAKIQDVQEDQKRAGPYDIPGRRPS